MVDLAIVNGTIVNPTGTVKAGIAVDRGKIVAMAAGDNLPPAKQTIDATDRYILPGLIDPHVHLGNSNWGKRNPDGRMYCWDQYEEHFAEEVKTETRAAVAAGVTTLGVFQRIWHKSTYEIFDEYKALFEQNAVCDGFFHHKVGTLEAMDDIPKVPELGINSFKFVPGYGGKQAKALGRPPHDDGWVYRGLEKVGRLGTNVWGMVHAENADIMVALRGEIEGSGRKDLVAWRDTRPNFVEAEKIAACVNIARAAGCRLYIVHITTGEGMDVFAKAKAEMLEVRGEVCVQNLTHTCEEPVPILKEIPALGVMNPPLRDKASIEKLWQGIGNGIIDTLASDTVVQSKEEKGNDIWTSPASLGNTTEMILPIMLSEGVNKDRITLEKVAEVCSFNTAKIFGLVPQKGIIAVGSDADLVIVDLHKKVKVTSDTLHSACDWTIYEGWEVTGWPVATIFRGQVAMEDGKVVSEPGTGRILFRRSN